MYSVRSTRPWHGAAHGEEGATPAPAPGDNQYTTPPLNQNYFRKAKKNKNVLLYYCAANNDNKNGCGGLGFESERSLEKIVGSP